MNMPIFASQKANCFIPPQYDLMSVVTKRILPEGNVDEAYTATTDFVMKHVQVISKKTGKVVSGTPQNSRKRTTAASHPPDAAKIRRWAAKQEDFLKKSKDNRVRKDVRTVAEAAYNTIAEMMNEWSNKPPARKSPTSQNGTADAASPRTGVTSVPSQEEGGR